MNSESKKWLLRALEMEFDNQIEKDPYDLAPFWYIEGDYKRYGLTVPEYLKQHIEKVNMHFNIA